MTELLEPFPNNTTILDAAAGAAEGVDYNFY